MAWIAPKTNWASTDGVANTDFNRIEGDILALKSTGGLSAFNGTTGVTITHNFGSTAYTPIITPTANPNGYLGEVYVTIAASTMTVYCTGSATTAFSWAIVPQN